jgi:hypothetical protein
MAAKDSMTEKKKRMTRVPDKPTGVAPGDVDYPGKRTPHGAKRDAAETPADRRPQGGRSTVGKTGPKGANLKSATQS